MKKTNQTSFALRLPFIGIRKIETRNLVRGIIILLIFMMPILSKAQVSLITTPIGEPNFKSEDVWNISVTNLSQEDFNAHFIATIRNQQQAVVVSLTSENFRIEPGSFLYTPGTLNTQRKQYKSDEVASYESLTGQLPPGNYSYCVELVCSDATCMEVIGPENSLKSCEQINKETTTPLLLSMPRDEERISTKRPDFNWIAPMPIGTDPNLTYRITLVKLLEGQSPEDGLKRNRALYVGQDIKGTSIPFPQELEDLEIGERYGWQVEAWINTTFVAISDAWEFEIDEEEEEVAGMPYVRLKKGESSIYNAVNDLKFIYNEPLRKNALNIRFYDSKGKDVTPDGVLFETTFGENKFTLDLRQYNFVSGEHYRMEIVAPNGEQFDLKFKYVFQFMD
ncbi:MAG: hypothetical protein JJ975_07905 [Bacteroidia bacterium]|nr:hypothetical protein [Bacteroidia bacterium]